MLATVAMVTQPKYRPIVPSVTIVSTMFFGGDEEHPERPDEHEQKQHDDRNARPEKVELHAENPRGIENQREGDRVTESTVPLVGLLRRQKLPDRVGDEPDIDDRPDREGGAIGRDGRGIRRESATGCLGDRRSAGGTGPDERPDDGDHRADDDDDLAETVIRFHSDPPCIGGGIA